LKEFVNILPIIHQWIDEHRDQSMFSDDLTEIASWSHISRADLINWVNSRYPQYNNADLVVDCLIAAGIGNEAEQKETVYGKYTNTIER
jgi:hypothetical protein